MRQVTTELAAPVPGELKVYEPPPLEEVVRATMAKMSAATREGYSRDLQRFAEYLKQPNGEASIRELIRGGRGWANLHVTRWIGAMTDQGLGPATTARRVAAVKAMIKVARTMGLIEWFLEVSPPKVVTLRDTRGPQKADVVKLMNYLGEESLDPFAPAAKRDYAIVRIMLDVGLRRNEVTELELEHVDFAGERVSIMGKARRQREWVTLPPETLEAISRWLEARGRKPGALFVRVLQSGRLGKLDKHLANKALWRILERVCEEVGVKRMWPHGLRHASITQALDSTDVRHAQRFARHAKADTTMRYDDARADLAGKTAREVAKAWK